jgi:hypothetical protein
MHYYYVTLLATLPNVYYTAAHYTYPSAPQRYPNVYYPAYYDHNHIVSISHIRVDNPPITFPMNPSKCFLQCLLSHLLRPHSSILYYYPTVYYTACPSMRPHWLYNHRRPINANTPTITHMINLTFVTRKKTGKLTTFLRIRLSYYAPIHQSTPIITTYLRPYFLF